MIINQNCNDDVTQVVKVQTAPIKLLRFFTAGLIRIIPGAGFVTAATDIF